jgi:hypothetical protein
VLSLVDLIEAGTVDLPLAAYLAATMRSGASLLIGARPGGAGKTAVMCALLNFLPDHTAIQAIAHPSIVDAAERDPQPGGTCYLAHEIGAGSWYAYVWGSQARAFFALTARGHIVASNLHADTLEETRDQLCSENGVARAHLNAVTLKVYLRMTRSRGRSVRRWVSHVYESSGTKDRLIWKGARTGVFARLDASASVSTALESEYAGFLDKLIKHNTRQIADVRRALVQPSMV